MTASTALSAARIRARSCSPTIGRNGPLTWRTDSSLLSATIRRSPLRRASSSNVMCPMCRMSKHPLVNTTQSPADRHIATRESNRFNGKIFSSMCRESSCAKAPSNSSRWMGTVPTLFTTIPAAKFANWTAVSKSTLPRQCQRQDCDDRIARPRNVINLEKDRGGVQARVPAQYCDALVAQSHHHELHIQRTEGGLACGQHSIDISKRLAGGC